MQVKTPKSLKLLTHYEESVPDAGRDAAEARAS